jgi:toxin ParE1/3/4
MRIIRRETYARDIDSIVDHIATDNPSAALAMWDAIERQAERLGEFPLSGRTGRMPETRELVVSGTPFVLVYFVADDVELIRVLHGAQQWPPDK